MSLLKQIGNILLIVILLLATTGVTMHKHYCMGRLKNVSFYEEAHSCMKLAGMDDSCPMDCCKDTSEEFRIDDLQTTSFDFTLQTQYHLLWTSSLTVDLPLLAFESRFFLQSHPYKPPLIVRNIPVQVQSFLL